MNMIGALKAAYAVSPFERQWRRMSRSEKRALLTGNSDYGWFARTDPEVDHLIDFEDATHVEMALRSRGWNGRDYLAGDYEKIGSKQATEWGE